MKHNQCNWIFLCRYESKRVVPCCLCGPLFWNRWDSPKFCGPILRDKSGTIRKNISVSLIIYKKVQLFGQMGRTSSAVSYFWANYTKKIWIKSFKMSATLKCRAELFASLKFFWNSFWTEWRKWLNLANKVLHHLT